MKYIARTIPAPLFLVIIFITHFFSTLSSQAKSKENNNLVRSYQTIASIGVHFRYEKAYYICSAYSVPDSNISRIVVKRDGLDGEIVFKRSFEIDTDQSITELQTWDGIAGEYLVVFTLSPSGRIAFMHVIGEKDNKIQSIADLALDCTVEFADIDNDGVSEIIVSHGRLSFDSKTKQLIEAPTTASIYKWENADLKLDRTVPWRKRLCGK